MSLSNLIRRHVHPATVLCRHRSSTAVKLPDHKLRALVSLYHQADNFITLENLSERIDEAFVKKHEGEAKKIRGSSTSVKDMYEILKFQRDQARIAEWDRQLLDTDSVVSGNGWKEIQKRREAKVKQALYGLDINAGPGIEILKEVVATKGKILKQLRIDASSIVKEEVEEESEDDFEDGFILETDKS